MLLWPGPRLAVVTLGRNFTNSSIVETFNCGERVAGHGLDRKGDVLQAFRPALCRHDDLFQAAGRRWRLSLGSRSRKDRGDGRCDSVIHAVEPLAFVVFWKQLPHRRDLPLFPSLHLRACSYFRDIRH